MTGWIVAGVVMVVAGILIYCSRTKETPARPAETTQRTTPQQTRVVPLSQKNETGPMVYYANDRHGGKDREYRFNYKKVNGSWRAYILRMPSLGNRDARSIPTAPISTPRRKWPNVSTSSASASKKPADWTSLSRMPP